MKACVTGATGFVGTHVVRALVERGDDVRAAYRDRGRLERLGGLDVETVRADVLDRKALRRAAKGSDVLFHAAGLVASSPARRVWEANAMSARVAVEAAAGAGVPRVVLTSSVAAIGPVPAGEVGSEDDLYRGGGLGLTYADAKHEGEAEALAAAARTGIELVIVNPCYVLGVPVDRSYPGETSARTVANYMRGRLPAVVDGETDIVDVEDVAAGHVLAAEHGTPGERYVLGGHRIEWVDLIDRIAHISGVSKPLVVIPREVAGLAKIQSELGLPGPISPQAYVLMAQNWSYSSAKARRDLGYRARPLIQTLEATIEWCRELIAHDAFDGRPTSMSLAASGLAFGQRLGLISALRAAESRVGRRLVAGA